MATSYVTGPVFVWVRVPITLSSGPGGGGQLLYVGTGLKAPRYTFRENYAKVHNDLSGPIVPFDTIWAGGECFVSVAFTRWTESVLQQISTPATDVFGSRGTLMASENANHELILRFGHANRGSMVAAGMPPGIRFISAHMEGEQPNESGTDANVKHRMWYCQGKYNPIDGSFPLYDFNMDGVPPLPPPNA